jgi:hypothetical protein
MFTLYDIGKAFAIGGFIGFYFGTGWFIMIRAWCKSAQPEPKPYPGYDVQDEVDMIMESMEL